jgi:hypothetical protein
VERRADHISPRWILAFGLAIGLAAQLPSVLGGWYLDADDWLLIRMGREVVAEPLVAHFAGFWTEEPTWRPLLTARAALEYALFEDAIRPRILINLGLHLACALMLFLLARAWLGREPAAAWAAVLFFVHPMHGEALAWYHSGFEGITVTLPILVTLWAWATRRPIWVALVAMQVALLARENALAIPFFIAAAAAFRAPSGSRMRRTIIESAPFFVLLVLNVAVRFIAVTMDADRASMGSFHIAVNPLAAVATTAFHPWLPIHPALPAREVWWLIFASIPFGLAWMQRDTDPLPLKVAVGFFVIGSLPFLPQFHDATRFLHAWPGGHEQRWYYFHLPLAGLVVWPAYVIVARDRRRTGWSTLALAALAGLFLTAQSFNARWWRDQGQTARAILDVVDDGLAQRPRGIGLVVTEGTDSATLADEVFLNLPVTRPDTARRGVHAFHLLKDSEHAAPRLQRVRWSRSGQVMWDDTGRIPPDVLWWTWNSLTGAMEPIRPQDLEVPVGALAPCCTAQGPAKTPH